MRTATRRRSDNSAPYGVALVVTLALLSAMGPFGIDMYLPAFPRMAEDLAAPASTIQLTLTTFLVGMAVGQLTIGPLSDRFGRRGPLLIGASVCLVATLLCAWAPTAEVLIVLRFVQGFCGAAGVVLSRAIVADRARGPAAARLFGVMMTITSLAPVLAPLAGAAVFAAADWRGIFLALGAATALMLVAAYFFAPESLGVDQRLGGGTRDLAGNLRTVLGDRRYLGYTLTLAFASMALFCYISASPFVLQNVVGLSPTAFSLTFAGASIGLACTSALSARLTSVIAPRRLLCGGVLGLTGLSLLLLLTVTVAGVPTWPTIVLIVVTVASLGFVIGNATALAIAQVRHAAGTGSAVLGAAQFLLGACASPLVGLGGDHDAVPMGLTLFAAAVLASAALFRLTRERRGETPLSPVAGA